MTLQELQDRIIAVSANLAIWKEKFANPNSNSIEKAVAQQNIATFGNMLIQLERQEQALLATPSSEQRSEDVVDASQQSFLSKNKWWFIGGGVLLIGGIVTFLIIRRKNK